MATELPSLNELLKEAVKAFEKTFGKKPEIAACAPGKCLKSYPKKISI
jgi:hypothetical protein